jgi:hypothetical protein
MRPGFEFTCCLNRIRRIKGLKCIRGKGKQERRRLVDGGPVNRIELLLKAI